ncbi:hypothetical protein [Ornithinimicrobium sp. W1665]|uniref:hypothetical protein n=1 Tax=Ornithinimicrobium sp. W1665 TaxID=3416666 RepID=UPI003D6A0B2B
MSAAARSCTTPTSGIPQRTSGPASPSTSGAAAPVSAAAGTAVTRATSRTVTGVAHRGDPVAEALTVDMGPC